MNHEAFFIWEVDKVKKVSEEEYREWLKTFSINKLIPPFGVRTTKASFNIFAQYDGHIDYYDEGLEIAPFVLHYIEDQKESPGNRDNDEILYFTSPERLMIKRAELIKQIGSI